MCWKCYKAQVENEKLNLPGLQPVTGEKDGKHDAKFSGLCTMVYCCPFRRATSNVTFRCEKVLTFSSWELQVFGSNIKRTNLTSIMKVVTDKEMRNAKFPKYKHVFRS